MSQDYIGLGFLGVRTINICMRAKEFLLESGVLDAALKRGWVNIKYIKLNGKPRVMTATTSPKLFSYTYKRPNRKKIHPRNKIVWERGVGFRMLRRNRILGWEDAGPIVD